MRPCILGIWLLLLGSFVSALATSRAEAAALPVIVSHSQLEFAVYMGDQVSLAVDVNGEKIDVKWVMASTTFCRSLTCSIDTKELSLGLHTITFVVFNERGSLFLKYKMRVLTPPSGRTPQKVKPPTVEANRSFETVSEDDWSVRALQGRGYSYHRRKVQVIGPMPRTVDWQEKLRTQPDSLLWLGRDRSEAHLLGAESSVYLAQVGSGRRAIMLAQGALRSRQLDGKEPRWSLLVDDWLQIDTDAQGDVLVVREDAEEAIAKVFVVRGQARVFMRRGNEADDELQAGDPDVTGSAILIPQGMAAVIERGNFDKAKPYWPRAKTFQARLRETAPFHARGAKWEASEWAMSILADRRPKDFAKALHMARDAVAQRDFVTAIEALADHGEKLRKDYQANLVLGEAYQGILNYEDAFHHYLAAANLRPSAGKARFMMGAMYMADQRWKAAIPQLEKAAKLSFQGDRQLLYYYLGVAHHRLGQFVAADTWLEYAQWEKGRAAVYESAAEFRATLQKEGWLDVRLGAGGLFDTNVRRLAKEAAKERGDGSEQSLASGGYRGQLAVTAWGVRQDQVWLGMSYDASYTAWTKPALKDLSLSEQLILLQTGFAFAHTESGKAWFQVALEPALRTVYVGKERAYDQLATDVALASPAAWGLELRVRSELNVDPLPARDDQFDPLLGEPSGIGERSHRYLAFRASLTPLDLASMSLSLTGASGKAVFRNEMQAGDHFRDQGGGLAFVFKPSLRQHFSLALDVRDRFFHESEDRRKDAAQTATLAWKWHYTSVFAQRLAATHDQHRSNRAANSFARQAAAFELLLEF